MTVPLEGFIETDQSLTEIFQEAFGESEITGSVPSLDEEGVEIRRLHLSNTGYHDRVFVSMELDGVEPVYQAVHTDGETGDE